MKLERLENLSFTTTCIRNGERQFLFLIQAFLLCYDSRSLWRLTVSSLIFDRGSISLDRESTSFVPFFMDNNKKTFIAQGVLRLCRRAKRTRVGTYRARTKRNTRLRITLNMKVSHARNVVYASKYRFLQDGYQARDKAVKTESMNVWCKCKCRSWQIRVIWITQTGSTITNE